MRREKLAASLAGLLLLAACQRAPVPPDVPLFEGLGSHRRVVTTSSPEAQKYFDQGLSFLYGFNHDEAIRSFSQAAGLDPKCAMAWWGIAYANGPHINNSTVPEARAKARPGRPSAGRGSTPPPARRWNGP